MRMVILMRMVMQLVKFLLLGIIVLSALVQRFLVSVILAIILGLEQMLLLPKMCLIIILHMEYHKRMFLPKGI